MTFLESFTFFEEVLGDGGSLCARFEKARIRLPSEMIFGDVAHSLRFVLAHVHVRRTPLASPPPRIKLTAFIDRHRISFSFCAFLLSPKAARAEARFNSPSRLVNPPRGGRGWRRGGG